MARRPDFTSQTFYRDIATGTAALRASGPMVKVKFPIIGRVWVATTHELASRLLKGSDDFTLRRNGTIAGARWWMPATIRAIADNMLTMDEPDHSRLRGLVDEAFRRRAILAIEPRILAIAADLARDFPATKRSVDLIEGFARVLPLAVICELLGLPQHDRAKFMMWTSGFTNIRNAFGFLRAIPAIKSLRRYLQAQLDDARVHGGDGLIAELVRLEAEGARMTPQEMVAMVFLLLAAGTETTTHLISGSSFELLRNPKLRDWLAEDWQRANVAVEEFLRFVSPVQFSKPRFVQKDIDLGGVRLRKGERVIAMLAAANMDPTTTAHPETCDLARVSNNHLAFGTGIHFCLGHQLARLEARCALQALFTRWPNLELAVPEEQILWR